MVKYIHDLDSIFACLSDPIRRDIISKVAECEYLVGELVTFYDVSFADISKHVKILERAGLVDKRKDGKRRLIRLAPGALQPADDYIKRFMSGVES